MYERYLAKFLLRDESPSQANRVMTHAPTREHNEPPMIPNWVFETYLSILLLSDELPGNVERVMHQLRGLISHLLSRVGCMKDS